MTEDEWLDTLLQAVPARQAWRKAGKAEISWNMSDEQIAAEITRLQLRKKLREEQV